MIKNSKNKLIDVIEEKRGKISDIISEVDQEIRNNHFYNFIKYIRENPFVIFIESLIVAFISFLLLNPIYNFLFAVSLSPITVFIFFILIGFIIVVPINLILNSIYSRFKKKKLLELEFKNNLESLAESEGKYLQEIFKSSNLDIQSNNLEIFNEIEIDKEIIFSSLFFKIFKFKSINEELLITGERMHDDIFGKYLIFNFITDSKFKEMRLKMRNKFFFKCDYMKEKNSLRLLPRFRKIIRSISDINKILSTTKKLDIEIIDNSIKIILYEPIMINSNWFTLGILEKLKEIKNFISQIQ